MSADEQSLSIETLLDGFIPNRRGRKPANIPVIRDNDGNVIPRYLTEKYLGIRRANGSAKLKKLTTRHLKLVGMHLEGCSLEQISLETRCTISTVSRILNDPLAQQILKRVYADRQGEIQALGGRAIQTVRDGLDKEQPIGVRLRAVDRYAKIRETMLAKDKGEETAEDVIERMLARANISAENLQINFNVNQKDENE